MSNISLRIPSDQHVPKFHLLATAVKDAIADGRLKTGDSLPSVSYVCSRFGMSRDTVFKAYSILKEQGTVMSQPGKGYYVADSTTRVFVFLDTLKAYKEVLYHSLFQNLPQNVIADVNFHHYNPTLFKRLIDDSLGRYSKYIVMPFRSSLTEQALSKIPADRLLVIDWNVYPDSTLNAVYQDFGTALRQGLESISQRIAHYDSFHLLYPSFTYHPQESVDAFEAYCRSKNIAHQVERDEKSLDVERGRIYLTVSDRMLGRLLEQCRDKGLKVGQDVGIISYNETPMKKFIEDGISVFSTDFNEMGAHAARFVTDGGPVNICVKSEMKVRNS